MKDFIIKYGVLILALIGISQYWIIAAFNKWVRKGFVKTYKSGTISIGYDSFSGANISLNGTFRVFNKDIFINRIFIKVTRLRDEAKHTHEWNAFKSTELFISENYPLKIELPSGFLISPKVPYRFNISFYDNELMKDIKLEFSKYFNKWMKYHDELNKIRNESIALGLVTEHEIIEEQIRKIGEFRTCRVSTEVFGKLNSLFYWDAGKYSIELNVQTSKPDKTFIENYEFELTEEDSKNLKLNVITILETPIRMFLNQKRNLFFYSQVDYL